MAQPLLAGLLRSILSAPPASIAFKMSNDEIAVLRTDRNPNPLTLVDAIYIVLLSFVGRLALDTHHLEHSR